MIEYKVSLNNGNEALGIDERTITANEDLKTADEVAVAREIHHENMLIPEQVASSVLQNFCKAAANLMAMGFAIQLRNGQDVALRIYPDLHVKGGNINLERAKELDPGVTELTRQNAGQLVDKAGVTVRVRAECQSKFTELLETVGISTQRSEVVERAKVLRAGSTDSGTDSGDGNQDTDNTNTGNGNGDSNNGNGGDNPGTGGGNGSSYE